MSGTEALSPEKQRQILRGAGLVFAREGYEGASMSRIAGEAGVSKGTLYNYFAGKADLFAAFVEEECSRTIAAMFDACDDGVDPETALARIGEQMVRMIVSPTGLTIFRVTVSEAAKFPELARTFYEAGPARATGHMADWLTRQTLAGRLAVEDPRFAAEQFLALCQTQLGMLCRLQLLAAPSDAEVGRVVASSIAMFLRTYAAPPSRQAETPPLSHSVSLAVSQARARPGAQAAAPAGAQPELLAGAQPGLAAGSHAGAPPGPSSGGQA